MDDKRALISVPGRRQARREHWAKIVAGWEDSQLSGVEFAEQRGIDVHLLYRWRRRVRRAGLEPVASGMLEVPRVAMAGWAAEVTTARGPVRLSMAVSPAWAAELIRELARC
jgi:transposase-like protein